MFCQECGAQNEETAKFCSGCGAALVGPNQAQASQPSTPQSDEQQPSYQQPSIPQAPSPSKRHWIVTLGMIVWGLLTAYVFYVMVVDVVFGFLIGAILAMFTFVCGTIATSMLSGAHKGSGQYMLAAVILSGINNVLIGSAAWLFVVFVIGLFSYEVYDHCTE